MDRMPEGSRPEKYREHQPEVALEDGSPLYHVFIDDDLVVAPHQREQARDRFVALQTFDPDGVEACDGKSAEEALAILEAIESRMNVH